MKGQLCLMALICLVLITNGQTPEDGKAATGEVGIKWTTGLSWEQIKQKAKEENKYIFLDCITTWCGPCRTMDQSTYLNDAVGRFYNENFISVKVQMDKTKSDNDNVKKWYDDAVAISKQYYVEGYPTFVFLSPNGQIVHKGLGLKEADKFIAMGEAAIVPGKVYNDEYTQYEAFVKAYKVGQKDFSQYPKMIMIALKVRNTGLFSDLQKELVLHISELPRTERYTKEMIEMWSSLIIPSTTRVFNFFNKDGDIIDKVIGIKGYAADIVDRTIQRELCVPFMEEQAKGSGIAMQGMYLSSDSLGAIKTVAGEADWNKLYSMIKKKHGKRRAELGLLGARIEWSARHHNVPSVVKYSLMRFKKFPPDINNGQGAVAINSVAFDAFLSSNDAKVLNECISLMGKLVNRPGGVFHEAMDTYANLLYKTGRTQEAIEWQEKALEKAPGNESYVAALNDMKLGKPTYVFAGAVWPDQKNEAKQNKKTF